jgi:hypothetical protein
MDLGHTVVVRMLLRYLGIPEFNLPSRILFRSKLELMEGCEEVAASARSACGRRWRGLEDLGGLAS